MGSALWKLAAAVVLVFVGISFVYFVANLVVRALVVVAVVWLVARMLGAGRNG